MEGEDVTARRGIEESMQIGKRSRSAKIERDEDRECIPKLTAINGCGCQKGGGERCNQDNASPHPDPTLVLRNQAEQVDVEACSRAPRF